MTKAQILAESAKLAPWYHAFHLPCDDDPAGAVIVGEPYGLAWDNIRKQRMALNYIGKNVLDIATFDGMWAFEAEKLGAEQVIATDCMWRMNPLFIARAKQSKVIFLLNVPPHELKRRLDSYFAPREHWQTIDNRPRMFDPKFDIVQHLGLLYHLRDPLQSLLQARSVIQDDGMLLLETAYYRDSDQPVMMLNTVDSQNVYADHATWWAPSLPCLREMLVASCFEPMGDPSIVDCGTISRVCLLARAVPMDKVNDALAYELRNTYRTPGLEL